MKPADRGFTLLEIIISLAIAALGIAAVAKATGGAVNVADETRERMLAVWVAGNRLADLKIARAWPGPGAHDTSQSMGGRTWYLTETVSETELETIRRVEIVVYTDVRRDQQEYQTFGFIARFQPPENPAGGQDNDGLEESDEPDTGVDPNEDIPLPGDELEPEASPAGRETAPDTSQDAIEPDTGEGSG